MSDIVKRAREIVSDWLWLEPEAGEIVTVLADEVERLRTNQTHRLTELYGELVEQNRSWQDGYHREHERAEVAIRERDAAREAMASANEAFRALVRALNVATVRMGKRGIDDAMRALAAALEPKPGGAT